MNCHVNKLPVKSYALLKEFPNTKKWAGQISLKTL